MIRVIDQVSQSGLDIKIEERSEADHPGWTGFPVPPSVFVEITRDGSRLHYMRFDTEDAARAAVTDWVKKLGSV